MRLLKSFGFYLVFLLIFNSCKQQTSVQEIATENIQQALETLFPDAEISSIENKDHFKESFQLVLKEPLDHNNPSAGTFEHYVYLSHFDIEKPVILVTEGYGARPRTYELSRLLDANQVMVEYRFYGKSRPEPVPWEYLKNDQAIEDYHQLVEKLKKIYKGPWVSTGISKGGETVLIYKSKYPEDIDVAVPYVAPLINTQEDPRTTEHINSVGEEACREKIKNFQRRLLENREELIGEIETHATEKEMKFTQVPVAEALEYAALEFSFSFWQWGGNCEEIPDENANSKEIFDYVNKIVGISFYSDKVYHDLLPSFYQHMVELGYYGFDMSPVEDLLQIVKDPTNSRFAPKNTDLSYDPEYIKRVRDYAETKGDKILYIYGEYDTWGACAPSPKPEVDALKMVLKKGHHGTRIRHFSKEDQEKIYAKLKEWMGEDITLNPLYAEEE
ncbi:hypothetical protein GWK08_05025 [Leptobacterium flavescens]|uniref:Aminopeptidase n=1 Tax=Leptobacterium flavescens TaxID=472055 RepID=A0A6P0UHI2_9FLAO|nr:S28 family serine protease [Leptobacterium flavescens]NER12791.1 hypothetical protein [Leptobacterium flavescens]